MSLYDDVLRELQYYILNEDNIKKSLDIKMRCFTKDNVKDNTKDNVKDNNKDKYNKNNNSNIEAKKIKNPIFIPSEADTLFWCFYILKNGDSKYETMYTRNEVVSRQIKIEYVEKIRKNKQIVKTYKFDTITNIENNLGNEKTLNVKTFLTLCAIENMNVLFVKNKTYYELRMNDSESITIIYCLNNKETKNYQNRYGFEIKSIEFANEMKSSLYKIDNVDKPIKAVSSYNVSELTEICNKLAIDIKNVETGKNKSKNELYESIIQYF